MIIMDFEGQILHSYSVPRQRGNAKAHGKNLCGVMFNNHFYPVTSTFVHHSARCRVEKLLALNPNSENFGTSVYDPVRKCKFSRKRETDDEITREKNRGRKTHTETFLAKMTNSADDPIRITRETNYRFYSAGTTKTNLSLSPKVTA